MSQRESCCLLIISCLVLKMECQESNLRCSRGAGGAEMKGRNSGKGTENGVV